MQKLKNVEIPVRSIEFQYKFEQICSNIRNMKNNQVIVHKELELLFKSLMKKAFNGEL
jgi:hypothetical protein